MVHGLSSGGSGGLTSGISGGLTSDRLASSGGLTSGEVGCGWVDMKTAENTEIRKRDRYVP